MSLSTMGCRFQMFWGHTFVFGTLATSVFVEENLKNLKPKNNFKT